VQIADNIQRLLPQGKDVGFCFSYPVEMQSDKDGVVKMFAKEIKAPEVVGTKVGQSTLQAVKTYSDVKRNIVILNDTVATLLGGIAVSKRQYGAHIGYIYGTGTNVCYMEHSEKIGKITDAEVGRRMLINTECGNFNLFPQGDYDKLVANETAQPDKQMFEKMTSGKYLSRLMELCLQGAAADGEFAVHPHICPFELKDVTPFLQGEQGVLTAMFGYEQDAAFAREVCFTLIDRAAKLGAIANAAAAVLSGTPNGLPIAIVAEGTTFRKLFGYAQKFTAYLQEILQPYGISFELLQGEELNMLGSLLAVSD
jgi:hexokinase